MVYRDNFERHARGTQQRLTKNGSQIKPAEASLSLLTKHKTVAKLGCPGGHRAIVSANTITSSSVSVYLGLVALSACGM
jgi:hypothetical protein